MSANFAGQDSGNHVTFKNSANKTLILFGPLHWALAAFLTLGSTAKGDPPLTQRTFYCGDIFDQRTIVYTQSTNRTHRAD